MEHPYCREKNQPGGEPHLPLHFFYDNCTTRARNMIIDHFGYQQHQLREFKTTLSTYREEIHRLNAHHRWARFGNDLLPGLPSRPCNKTNRKWESLPDNLSMDFAVEARKDTAQQPIPSTTVYPQEPRYIKLVDSTFYLISPKEE